MKLQSLRVKNFRAIKDSGVVKVGKCNAFIGKNGSGKTTIFEAINKFNDITHKTYNSNGKTYIVEMQFDLMGDPKSIHEKIPEDCNIITVKKDVFKQDSDSIYSIYKGVISDRYEQDRNLQIESQSISGKLPNFNLLTNSRMDPNSRMDRIQYIIDLQNLNSANPITHMVWTDIVSKSGYNAQEISDFIDNKAYSSKNSRDLEKNLKNCEEYIQDCFIDFGIHQVKPEIGWLHSPARLELKLQNNIPGVEIDSDQTIYQSAGILFLANLYFNIRMFGQNRNIILMENPDFELHSKIQQDLMFKFESINHQILYTTHSKYMIPTHNLSGIKICSYNNTEKGIVVNDLDGSDQDEFYDIREALDINLNAGNPRIPLNTEVVILCEGYNNGLDQKCYNKIYKDLYPNFMFMGFGCDEDLLKLDYKSTKENIFVRCFGMDESIKLIGLVDGDAKDKIPNNAENILSLPERNIESWLLSREVLTTLCDKNNLPDKVDIISKEISELSIDGNLKNCRQKIQHKMQSHLDLPRSDTFEKFALEIIVPCIKPGTKVYDELLDRIKIMLNLV